MEAQSLHEFLDEHGSALRRLGRALVRDAHLAEDLTQEACVRYLEQRSTVASVHAWLRRVVQNLARDAAAAQARRRHYEAAAAQARSEASAADLAARGEVLRAVAGAVQALSDGSRDLVMRRYVAGHSARRIAAELGIPVATVRSRLQRALAELRRKLDRDCDPRWSAALAVATGGAASGTPAVLLMSAAVKGAAALAVVALAAWAWLATRPSPTPAGPLPPVVAVETAARDAEPRADEAASERSPAPIPAGFVRVAGSVERVPYPDLDLPGGPAADVEVSVHVLRDPDRSWDAIGSTTTRTHDAGGFEALLEDPGFRPLHVVAVARTDAHHREAKAAGRIEADHVEVGGLRILQTALGVLPGLVVDGEDQPVPGVPLTMRIRVASGEAEAQVVSDAAGRFRLQHVRSFHGIRTTDPRHVVLGYRNPRFLDGGGFDELRVTVGPTATLQLVARDADGAPVPGLRVEIEMEDAEHAALAGADDRAWIVPDGSGAWMVTPPRVETDDRGRATFEGLWAERMLRFSISGADLGMTLEAIEEQDGGLVLARSGEIQTAFRPIVLAPGSARRLEIRLDRRCVVAGRVLEADRRPAANAEVFLIEGSTGAQSRSPSSLRVGTTDADGRFELHLTGAGARAPLTVLARTRPTRPQGWSTGFLAPTDGGVAHRTIDAVRLRGGRAEVELVLQPTLAIAGRLIDADGSPAGRRHRIWVTPAGAAHHRVSCAVPRSVEQVDEGGRFEAWGLEPGRYDLWVSRETGSFYSFAGFLHRFANVAAGTRGLELRLPERREVRVTLRAHGVDVERMLVFVAKRFPVDPERHPRKPAARAIVVDGVSPWPEGASYGFSGIGGIRSPEGDWSVGYDSVAGARHEAAALEAGWYAFGVRAFGGSQEYACVATEELWFEAGEYVIDFELRPATSVTGRVALPARAGEGHVLCLVTPDGRPVPLQSGVGHGDFVSSLPVSATGRFVLRDVPVGEFRLRLHTAADAGTGAFRCELPVSFVPGRNPEIVIR